MDFNYKKLDNAKLFNQMSSKDFLNLEKIQNYIPLYTKFFSLNERNYDKISLNNINSLTEIIKMNDDNNCLAYVTNNINNKSNKKKVFFKYGPLLDPSKYLIGKYNIEKSNLLELPTFNEITCHSKTNDPNNSAYVDGFFSYLSGSLLHTNKFLNALEFYGSYLAKKNNFQYNIADDLEYLNESPFFHDNRGKIFDLDNIYANELLNFNTRGNKNRLCLNNDEDYKNDLSNNIIQLCDIKDLTEFDNIFTNGNNSTDINDNIDLVFDYDISVNKIDNESSECSSRSSVTDNEDEDNENEDIEDEDNENEDNEDEDNENEDIEDEDNENEDNEDEEENSDSYSTASEDIIMATIKQFPVQIIAIEKCENTLDDLIVSMEDNINDEEIGAIMAQVILTLYTYNKAFGFTHNDLHTNNIMYVNTDKQFLYYKCENKYFKIPTYGKIFKIIDFGRAIYKFRGNIICSDSFHPKGDAATQYNFEPYFNPDKPRLEPNFSFDLCRLGCSLYDFIIDDVEEDEDKKNTAAKRMIINWCMDDKGRNVLYKQNGEERYPDFKLYKMITRTVHNHTPQSIINGEYFNRFIISKKKINKKINIINIDDIISYQ